MWWGVRAPRGGGDKLGVSPHATGLAGCPTGLVPGPVAPGEMLEGEMDAEFKLDLEMNLENLGKWQQIKSAVCYLVYIMCV